MAPPCFFTISATGGAISASGAIISASGRTISASCGMISTVDEEILALF